MLELRNIVKQYVSGDTTVKALNGVSLRFRENEFVSILGASGCGKTTMLNIIGGLDRYSKGDLIINGRSTKNFHDRDWDTYRNHSIGFVFQSYNLIPHQTVLSNVELALTLSGVSRSERRARAVEALTKVGLGDQLHKKPNQMSGGQMQRVAIARALVNNPDILLADEPTGALDTQTSVQIMELLKEVAADRLVIMVTHNPELAEQYSTRIVRLSDGEVVDDSAPVSDEEMAELLAAQNEKQSLAKKQKKGKKEKTSMSFLTALSLSKNNLLTKKGRTILTSFAGSIGIIGIALILALSNGIQVYINTVQEDTLSTYPLSIQESTADYGAMLQAMQEVSDSEVKNPDPNKIYVEDSMGTLLKSMTAKVENDLTAFKAHIEANYDDLKDAVSDIQYTYNFDLQVYTADGKVRVSPTELFENLGDTFAGMSDMITASGMFDVMSEMIGNQELLDQQYELVGEKSHWPEKPNEVVLVIGENNRINRMVLYMLGMQDQEELEKIMADLFREDGKYESIHMQEYNLDDFLGREFLLLNTADYFAKTDKTYTVDGVQYPVWYDMREYGFGTQTQEDFIVENGTKIVISGIIRPKPGVTATSISGALGYTHALTDMVLDWNAESEIIAQQKKTPNNNVLNGDTFERTPYTKENIHDLIDRVGATNMARFYTIMTAMIRDNEEYRDLLNVTPDTIAMFIGVMADEEQKAYVAELLADAVANDTGMMPQYPIGEMNPSRLATLLTLVQQAGARNGLSSVVLTPDNLLDLLPLLSEEQVMLLVNGMTKEQAEAAGMPLPMDIAGLKTLCSEEKMTAIYDRMNAAMDDWQINEKSMTLLLGQMDDAMFATFEKSLYDMVSDKDATYDSMLLKLGDAEKATPASINFYAKDFDSKDVIKSFVAEYNKTLPEGKELQLSDLFGVLMGAVSMILDVISIVLIAFVSISLVVSSIMIGIITYISVLERTKEIGILRSIGASKRDISRVFNAETLIVGFAAGFMGIVVTLLLLLPANAIIQAVSGIPSLAAVLPLGAAVILVVISMVLTVIAGLIPSRVASKKDPVEALRTE